MTCALLLSACGAPDDAIVLEPKLIFADAEPLKHRHRNHSMTESPDGKLRVFAAQKGDVTDLMLMRLQDDGTWSASELLDLPKLETNTSPRFFPDGTLYYSSDGRHPERPGRKDQNIWRVSLEGGTPGLPEVLPDEINTGAHEDSFAPLADGRAIFSSTALGGTGGFDLYIASWTMDGWEVEPFAHNSMMADSHPVTTPDGQTLIWYAHLPVEKVYGVVDLFVSRKTEEGWSAPENLGPAVNTAGIDYGAGVSADGKTLFFSRDGILMETDLEQVLANTGYVSPEALPQN